MRLKISNRNSNLARIASKLGEPTALTQAGAMFLLALAHESAKAKAFEPLSEVQLLLAKSKPMAARLDSVVSEQPDEQALALQAGFDDLLSAWDATQTSQLNGDIDQAYEALTQISQAEPLAVLAQNTWRAPISDAAVDYVDPVLATPLRMSPEVPVQAPAPQAQGVVIAEEPLILKMEPELPLDPNNLGATSAGFILPLPLVLGLVGGGAALAGSAGGGSGGGPGAGSTPVNNVATVEIVKDKGVVSANTTSADGKFTVKDPDTGQSFMQTQANIAGKYGTFSLGANGDWKYILNPDLEAYKKLPKDTVGTESFVVKSLDGSAQKTVTVDVIGINDAPVITSAAQSGNVKEDIVSVASGVVTASDIDSTSTLTYSGFGTSMYGSFLVKPNGQWEFTLENSTVQGFNEKTLVTEQFSVVARDEFGLSASQQVLINISGTNDAPQIVGESATFSGLQKPAGSATTIQKGSLQFNDVDSLVKAFTLSSTVPNSGELFSASIVDQNANSTHDGVVNFTYTATSSAAVGNKDFVITLVDDTGLSDSYTIHIGLV